MSTGPTIPAARQPGKSRKWTAVVKVRTFGQAMHEGLMTVDGPPELVRTLATLGLSRFAKVPPA
jgi:hypothetical protein